jgi:hypothetical protein
MYVGGKVKNALNLKVFGAAALMGVGLLLTGCKPDLTQANALAMIQAKYDQAPAAPINITVDKQGMGQGIAAKFWNLTKIYPNKYWADYTLTADGKKALKLAGGGEVIQWRPEGMDDKNFTVVVTTTVANHLKAKDIKEITDEVGGTKGASFTEAISLDGVPDGLQGIAHNPGNKLSTKKQASFVLDGGAWKLQSIN